MLTLFIHTSAALAVACGVLVYLLHRTRRHLADADQAVEQLENELEAYQAFEAEGDVFFSPCSEWAEGEAPSTWPGEQ